MKNEPEILFDRVDQEEEFEWTPSGTNIDEADEKLFVCLSCGHSDGLHSYFCPNKELRI